MGLLKEITNNIYVEQELVEAYDSYLAEIDASLEDKKFSILTEIELPNRGQAPFRSSAAETGVARDLQVGHEEARKEKAQQASPFIIVRKKDGTYTGTKADNVEWNASGTKSAKFTTRRSGDVWFDPDSKRQATDQERQQMAQRAPALAAGNFDVYDQMT